MGLFGGGKKSNAPGGVYVDMDGQPIPIAVAVSAAAPSFSSSSRCPSSPTLVGSSVQVVHPEPKQQQLLAAVLPFHGSRRSVVASPPSSSSGLMFLPPLLLSRFPTVVNQCPVCHQRNARTRIVTAPDFMTWTAVAVLLVLFWPLCWIPLVSDACRRTTHYCNSCQAPLGSVRPFQDCCVKRRY